MLQTIDSLEARRPHLLQHGYKSDPVELRMESLYVAQTVTGHSSRWRDSTSTEGKRIEVNQLHINLNAKTWHAWCSRLDGGVFRITLTSNNPFLP